MTVPAGHAYTQAEIDDCLTAVIAHHGCIEPSRRWLKKEGKRCPVAKQLQSWVRVHHLERYEELREKLAGVREAQLAHDYFDAASYAREVAKLAVSKAEEKLNANEDPEPAKSAASLARVSQSFIEKQFMLQSRPTKITETIDVEARVRKLVAMGVLQLPDGDPPALDSGDEE